MQQVRDEKKATRTGGREATFEQSRDVVLEVTGLAPQAARYAGFSPRGALWTALLVSGGTAGLAGALEVAGPVGQLTTHVPLGYGFAAIIVAFVGRLHPLGVLLASLLMSLLYLGGEAAQITLSLPSAVTGLFQGTLLFFLLAADVFINFRLRVQRRYVQARSAAQGLGAARGA